MDPHHGRHRIQPARATGKGPRTSWKAALSQVTFEIDFHRLANHDPWVFRVLASIQFVQNGPAPARHGPFALLQEQPEGKPEEA